MPLYISGTQSSPATTFELYADRIGQSVEGNYTTVRLYIRAVVGPGGSTSSRFLEDGHHYGAIDGIGILLDYHANPFMPGGLANGTQRWMYGPGDANIGHNPDGTHGGFTLRMMTRYRTHDVDWTAYFGDMPTIPRASQPTVSPTPVVAASSPGLTINTNRASTGFTHTLQYAFGNVGLTDIAGNVTDSKIWSPPISLLSQIPNSPTGVGTIRCYTYSGGTYLGAKDASFTLSVPTNGTADPTWAATNGIVAVENTAGVASAVGALVQGISTLKHTITGAAGQYGASIPIQKFEVAGQVVNGATGVTPAPINASGTVNGIFTITDSRGRTKTQTVPYTVLPYVDPVINSCDVFRSIGLVPDPDDGTDLRVELNAAVQSLMNGTQRNFMQIQISVKSRKDTTAWNSTHIKKTVNPTGITYLASSPIQVTGPFAIDLAYDVKVEVIDRFNVSSSLESLSVAEVTMHWGEFGVAVGKYWEHGALDVGGEIYHGELSGSVVEPYGIVSAFAGPTVPTGWLLCDGRSLLRASYPKLFAAIGVTYGSADATHFNIPNYSGRTLVGRDTTQTEFNVLGEVGGAKTHTLTLTEIPSHQHDFAGQTILWGGEGTVHFDNVQAIAGASSANGMFTYQNSDGWADTYNAGGDGAHNNLQPYAVVNYIMRAF